MSIVENKIDANDRSISEVLKDTKYTVDYFQREYKWEERHIEQLVSDLASSFLNEYVIGDPREKVEEYNCYYLGPFVVSIKDGQRSIIDGQQRLTSLTLILIYLNNLQKERNLNEELESIIFSEKYGKKSFNIQVDERIHCLEGLFNEGFYNMTNSDDESVINMTNRYLNIVNSFPDEIKGDALPYFIDWLKFNVVLVEIIAYSDENAYTIFETMNDRGLNLTPTEMLKSYILSRFKNDKQRQSANALWKSNIQELHEFDKDEDQRFVQAWLRSKYAQTIRTSKAGSINEDFEKIGTRFHNWFRDNLDKMSLDVQNPNSFEEFVEKDFQYYYNCYLQILKSEKKLISGLEHIYYIRRWGIANSLSYPLMMAPILKSDSLEVANSKMNTVAKFIEIFVVRRALNYRRFGSSSIRYTMNTLVKEIRDLSEADLTQVLSQKLAEMDEKISGIAEFGWHGQNGKFVKFFLARVTSYIEKETGMDSSFAKYFYNDGGKPYEIEHIWADKFERHKDEFEQIVDFKKWRNFIGALVLLPKGSNQSYNDLEYSSKMPHYIKENLLAQSLCEMTYKNNPNFLNMAKNCELDFRSHTQFKKSDIKERTKLLEQIAEKIWVLN